MTKFLVFFFIFISYCLSGQNIDMPKIVPPSPSAYEIGKFGQIPIGAFTGTPNVSVPIYSYETNNLSVPISLNYSSNGIKVDELSSNVGLGWSFQAGGLITRIVRDKPDEQRGVLLPERELQEFGLNSAEAMAFFQAAGEDDADTETDLYMYNFSGHSGKFIFDNNNKGIIMMPQTDLKVNIVNNGFKVTTNDGIVYSFLEQEKTSSRTYGSGHSLPEVSVVTSWYLSKIEHPKGDYIQFVYDPAQVSYSYDANVTESITKMVPSIQQNCNGTIIDNSQTLRTVTTKVKVFAKRLTKIKSNKAENGEVLIESNKSHPEINSYKLISGITIKNKNLDVIDKIDLTYYSTPKNRILLYNVKFLNPGKEYSFEYFNPDGMPARLSKSVDYFGYYNGRNNANRYPNPMDPFIKDYIPNGLRNITGGADKRVNEASAMLGLLRKVSYPTKGYNELEYETDSYTETFQIPPSQVTLPLLAISTESPRIVSDVITTGLIQFAAMADVRYNVDYNPCSYPSAGKEKAMLIISDDIGSQDIQIFRVSPNGGATTLLGNNTCSLGRESLENPPNNHLQVALKVGRVYTIKLQTMRECTYSSLNFSYLAGEPRTSTRTVSEGNLRVKRIKSFATSNSNTPESTIRYYYGKKESPEISSGQRGSRPYYVTNSTQRDRCGIWNTYNDIEYKSLNSNSIRQIYSSSDANTTYYKYVTMSYGGDNFEEGGIENEFLMMEDVQGLNIKGDGINGSPWVNTGWGNGLLKKETVFKKNELRQLVDLKETINSYAQDARLFQKVMGYTVLKRFDNSGANVNYICTQDDLSRQTTYWYCNTKHKHQWWIPNGKCITGDNRTFTIQHACFDQWVGKTITYPDAIENLDIMEYSSNSYWFYNDSSMVKEYFDNGAFTETITNYYYDNPNHLQQTRIESTTSVDGDKYITTTDYAHDLGVQELIESNRIAEPILVRKFLNEELLNSTKTVYDDFTGLHLPQAIQTAKGTEGFENRLIYHSYDGHGNLREVSQANGISTVYVMGYNYTLPVAKIENVKLSEISQSWLTPIYNAATEGVLINALSILRSNILSLNKEILVTTYTYKPLIGVSTITDPKGYRMTYEYDDFGRLKYVKDMEGKVLSKNEYHYKNN